MKKKDIVVEMLSLSQLDDLKKKIIPKTLLSFINIYLIYILRVK